MKNRFLRIAGIAVCAIALGLNLQNAFNGYGVKSGSMHPEVLAQTNTSGGSTTGGGTSGGSTTGGGTSGGGSTTGGGTGWSDEEDESCQVNYGSKPRTEACDWVRVRDGIEWHTPSVQRVCDRVADASKTCTPVECGGSFS